MDETGISRRNFLKGASLAALGVGGGLAVVGCSPAAPQADEGNVAIQPDVAGEEKDSIWTLEPVGEPTETITADVCIIGGGGTGMAAALQCIDLGLNPVVIEQLGAYGGSFIGTEFLTVIGSKQQAELGIVDSVHEAVDEHLTYHHWIPNRSLATAFLGQSAETAEWLEGHGMSFVFAAGYRSRGLAYEEGDEPMRGLYFVKRIGEELDRLGVEARFNTKARRVLVENGATTGILAEGQDGTITKIEAPVVIIGTGGYANNDEFRRGVSVVVNENTFAMGMECRFADGIKMAADAGADMAESLGTVQWSGPIIIDAITASWQTASYVVGVQPTLWLNQDAQRYMREDLWQENFPGAGICMRNQKRTYILFNDAQMQYWEANGPYSFPFSFGLPGTPMPTIRANLQSLDSVHKGDTLEDVAADVGLDPEALKLTVERYNELCAAAEGLDGENRTADEDFGKKAEYMHALSGGPFWLCEVAVGIFTTHGGIKINEQTEVIGTDGNIIAGLYAGGCDAGGLSGDSYDVMYCPGSGAGWAVNTGRLAAKSAARYLQS